MQLTKLQFKNPGIWENTIEIAKEFCCIADKLEKLNLKKFSEYLRDICLQISDNLSALSNSQSEKNITRFLTNTHLLTLEAENTIMIFYEQGIIDSETNKRLIQKLNSLYKEIKKYLIVPRGSKKSSIRRF
jgi:hypothetical protein